MFSPRALVSRTAILGLAMFLPATGQAGVKADSTMVMPGKSETAFAAGNLIDGDLKTVWIEGKDGPGIDASFVIDLPRCEVKKLRIMPGHGESERMFRKYSHLKEIEVSFSTVNNDRSLKPVVTKTFTLEDAFKVQELPIEGAKLGDDLFGGQLKVTIKSVYPGVDFKDNTAVGEVVAVLDEYPAQLEVVEASAPLKGYANENLVDADPKTGWVAEKADPGASITLNAPDYGITAVVVRAGLQKDPKKFKDYARPQNVTVEIGGQKLSFTLKDAPEAQRIDLPALNGYTGSHFGHLKLTIDSVYPGTLSQSPALSDISLMATSLNL